MSKYSETFRRLRQDFYNNDELEYDSINEWNILKEAIEKAKRYDWIMSHCAPKGMCSEEIYENTLKENLILNEENKTLKEELEFEKEHKAEYEFWCNKLRKENEMLKDGIKEILKKDRLFNYDFNNEKIKAMKEITEGKE